MKYLVTIFLSTILCLSFSNQSYAFAGGTANTAVVEETPIAGDQLTKKQARKKNKAQRKAMKRQKKTERLQNLLEKIQFKKNNKQGYWGIPLLIIGIIVLLAGAVVGIVFGLLGWLISVVGLVIIIVALLQIFEII